MRLLPSFILSGLILSASMLSLAGCGGEKPKPNVVTDQPKPQPLSPEQQLKADIANKIKTELGSAKKVNDLLAGFQFGMNIKTVERHTEKMAGRKVLRKVKKGKNKLEYVYQLPLADKNSKVDAFMDAEYLQGGLSKMTCYAKFPKGKSSNDFLIEISKLFTEWYGAPAFKLPAYNSCERMVWISGNRHVELRCELDGLHFDYTDLTVISPAEFDAQPNNTQVDIKDVSNK